MGNLVKTVAALHDISGLGRCSLSVVLPVLAAMGAQGCPLPTALLSAHMAFPAAHAAFRDLTEDLAPILTHWAEIGMQFDAIYSGFLASAAQVTALERLISDFQKPNALVLIDPVMGDHGAIYRSYTPELCQKICAVSARADLITPNLTEAAILLGEPFTEIPTGRARTEQWLARLSLRGARSVVMTGVSDAPGRVGAGCFDRETGRIHFAMAHQEAGQFGGTGDLFASVLLGALLRGAGLDLAAEQAVQFVQSCVSATLTSGAPALHGVQFEPLLGRLCANN